MLAEACGLAGRLDEGLEAVTTAQMLADGTGGETYWQPEILRVKGELHWQRTPHATQDAEGCLHQSLEAARRQQARSLELRAAVSLGQLWYAQGKTPAARELVATVYGTFTEGFQTYDLRTARALLEQWQQPGSQKPWGS